MPKPAPPNKGLQRTALGADKIGAILIPGIGPTTFPIYGCAAAEAQAVGPLHVPTTWPKTILDDRYNPCYTYAMKTAISLPDPLFEAAEHFAHAQGWSRSELYVRALQAYLQAHRYHGITDALNHIYATESSALDPALLAAQANSLPIDEW
jgi:hypothetical protein